MDNEKPITEVMTEEELKAEERRNERFGHLPEEKRPTSVPLSEVTTEKIEFLWEGRIPSGKITMLDGDPKVGKSTLALDLAARITTGRSMPDSSEVNEPRNVILMTCEDGLSDTVRPRFDAAEGDPSRIEVFQSVPVYFSAGQRGERLPQIPKDIDSLEALVTERDAVLVIVDVLFGYLEAGTDTYKDQVVRQALTPLVKLADKHKVAILLLRHPIKNHGGNPLHSGGGSIAFTATARSILMACVDPEDDQMRLLAVAGGNLAANSPSLRYRLANDEKYGVARIEWLGQDDRSAKELLITPDSAPQIKEAKEFLLEYLSLGERPQTEILQAAKDQGISESTLKRAKASLKVESKKSASGAWCWSLPSQGDHPRFDDPLGLLEPQRTIANEELNQGGQGDQGDHLVGVTPLAGSKRPSAHGQLP